jgi:predicted aspartyl protease
MFMLFTSVSCKLLTTVKVFSKIIKATPVQKEFFCVIPFEYQRNCIIVTLNIGGKNRRLILDTGATLVLSSEVCDEMKLKTYFLPKNDNDTHVIGSVVVDELSIKDVVFKNVGALRLDSSNTMFSEHCTKIDGLLGSNIFQHGVLQINYAEKKIIFTNDIQKLHDMQNALHIQFPAERLYVTIPIELNEKEPISLLLDTGYNGFISFNAQDSKPILASYSPDKILTYTQKIGYNSVFKETTTAQQDFKILLSNITLDKEIVKDILLQFGLFGNHSKRKNGVIGNGFLKNYIVTVDWLKGDMYLLPNDKGVFFKEETNFGIKCGFKQGEYIVGSVLQGSEAEKKGILSNDEVIEINGKNITNLSNEEICTIKNNNINLMDSEANELFLKIRRANKTESFVLAKINK